jgi:hypothetical protein
MHGQFPTFLHEERTKSLTGESMHMHVPPGRQQSKAGGQLNWNAALNV